VAGRQSASEATIRQVERTGGQGGSAPQRVPIMSPSSGVSPMVVSTLRPFCRQGGGGWGGGAAEAGGRGWWQRNLQTGDGGGRQTPAGAGVQGHSCCRPNGIVRKRESGTRLPAGALCCNWEQARPARCLSTSSGTPQYK
jgi:hypothetical protein